MRVLMGLFLLLSFLVLSGTPAFCDTAPPQLQLQHRRRAAALWTLQRRHEHWVVAEARAVALIHVQPQVVHVRHHVAHGKQHRLHRWQPSRLLAGLGTRLLGRTT